jgi:PEP-CTERM motif
MKTLLATVVLLASTLAAHAVVIQPNTTATFQFSALPLSQPSNIQVDPAAGYLDLGATVLPGQTLTISLFGDPSDATPFYEADWGVNFDGTAFNPDTWFDGTGAITLTAFGGPIDVSYITAGWVGGGVLHTANLLLAAEVPEPSTLGLIGLGLLGLGAMRRRRRKAT